MDPVWFRRPQTGTRDRAEKAAHPVTVSPGPGPGRIRTDLSTSQVAQQSRTHLLVQETRGQSLGREDPWRRAWLPAPVFLPGESHGQRSLAGYSPWGCKAWNMTEGLNKNKVRCVLPQSSPGRALPFTGR